jgi:hypothetical protein
VVTASSNQSPAHAARPNCGPIDTLARAILRPRAGPW